MQFAKQLKQAREEAQLSQSELAARAGINIDAIQNWEQGRTTPRLAYLFPLAQALGVDISALLGMTSNKSQKKREKCGKTV